MITYAHGNNNCTGSKLTVDFTPATHKKDGVYTFSIVNQTEVGCVNPDGTRTLAEFKGDESIFALTPKQAAHLLLVLEGKGKNINNGKGIFDNGEAYSSILHCDRLLDSPYGYMLHIITKKMGTTFNGRILLNPTEALLLSRSINASLDRAAFGN